MSLVWLLRSWFSSYAGLESQKNGEMIFSA